MYATCIVIEFTEFIIRGLTLEAHNLELIDMGLHHTVCGIHWSKFLWSNLWTLLFQILYSRVDDHLARVPLFSTAHGFF